MYFRDEPESGSLKFGHQATADWLSDKILNLQTPYRLAITGGLGTGKSTIILKSIDKLEKASKLKMAYVDLWKLDKESSRRSAIIKIAKDLDLDPAKSAKLSEKLYGTSTDLSRTNSTSYDFNLKSFLISIGIAVIMYLVLSAIPSLAADEKITIALIVAAFNIIFKALDQSIVVFKRSVTKAPIVGAEEFEECLQDILEIVNCKVAIVFDNLDRTPIETSQAILNGISTFFDYSHYDKVRDLIIIVPFDINSKKILQSNNESADQYELTEIAFKMFDSVIPLPKLIEEDLFDYTVDLLSLALNESCNQSQINQIASLIKWSPFNNPRGIKHIINEIYSQLSLAKTMENSMHADSSSTFLPKGMVLNYPVSLAKYIICNRICPNYIDDVMDISYSLEEIFNFENEYLSNGKASQGKIELVKFLKASSKLKIDSPNSPSPFCYLKGANRLLSTEFSQNIHYFLQNGDLENLIKLRNESGQTFTLSNIEEVFIYHVEKLAENQPHILFNSFSTYLQYLHHRKDEVQKTSIMPIAKVICDLPDFIMKIDLEVYNDLSKSHLDEQLVTDSWIKADQLYLDIHNEKLDVAKIENFDKDKWAIKYLVSSLQHEFKDARIIFFNQEMHFQRLLNPRVIEAMGEAYPQKFASVTNIFEAVVWLLTANLDENKVQTEAANGIIADFLSEISQAEALKDSFDLIATKIQEAIEKELATINQDSNSRFYAIALIVTNYPLKGAQSAAAWTKFFNWVVSQSNRLLQKGIASSRSGVLDLLVSFNAPIDQPNAALNAAIQGLLPSCSPEELSVCSAQWSKGVLFEYLQQFAPNQTLELAKKDEYLEVFLKQDRDSFKKWIIESLDVLPNKTSYFECYAEDKNAELADLTLQKYKLFKNHDRLKVVKKFLNAENKISERTKGIFVEGIKHYIETSDEVTGELIKTISLQENQIRYQMAEYARELLNSKNNVWTQVELYQTQWALSAPDQIAMPLLENVIEKAIGLGCTHLVNAETRKGFIDLIFKVWSAKIAFKKELYEKLNNVIKDQKDLMEKMEDVLPFNGLKKGFFGGLKETKESDD